MLEEIIAEIKRGEVNGLAIALLRPNDVVSTRRSGNSLRLLAGAARMLHQINKDCEETTVMHDPHPVPTDVA